MRDEKAAFKRWRREWPASFVVIASAAKQSRASSTSLDCFAALAMTDHLPSEEWMSPCFADHSPVFFVHVIL